ncbi:glycosyltransferase family 2 protein [Flavobacterium sp. J49]|uniref:glycosyltransferase family 2 protein n=1 Tax=Flavobacterium sp. J49 TaxID=2718534 RepID=UPI001594385A|nr:glycosyltransferase family A protein [Flavobacterium sp. J49]MBF6640095.1 glycosyltransferase family 2 protein [Flavobacterium sp. J49]NIC01340.1 glycosyltransferase family 2 protein [Flavobacterium sp. J49]
MPYFSIVIPVFNKEKFVANTLKSVLSQTLTDYEIIIVNDGSTDNSEAIINSFSDDRIRYFLKENEGVAVARNFGIDKANGAFVCFLDADDFWHPDFLKTMHGYIQKFPEQKVFACAIEIETQNKTFPANYSIAKKGDFEIVDFFDASQKECVLWTSSVVIHKSVFEVVGNFDTKIKKGEDTELWIRIGLQYPIVFIWRILARYVYDQSSVSRNLNYYFEPYTFEKYASEEKKNPKLKQYLDLNRFSAVIKCNLNNDWKTAIEIYKEIDLVNLSWKKRIILELPPIVQRGLMNFKKFLTNNGLGKSIFR